MDLIDIIKLGVDNKASDIHISRSLPPIYRVDGYLKTIIDQKIEEEDIREFTKELLGEDDYRSLFDYKEIDFSYTVDSLCRLRINAFLDRGSIAMAIRIIPSKAIDYKSLGLPPIIEDIIDLKSGLVLITGPAGSGKSTTMSSIIELINQKKPCHIITIEDPIEYIYKNKKSIINQREIGMDTKSFLSAIRGALRQDPDIICIGEMRDSETISAAINASETGHLVLSTMHTDSIANTISRIIDSFPAQIQNQIQKRLASSLRIIISQKLLSGKNSGRVLATEVMVNNNASKNIIRENKIHQIDNVLQTGNDYNMRTMDQSLIYLYDNNLIHKDILIGDSVDKDYIKKFI